MHPSMTRMVSDLATVHTPYHVLCLSGCSIVCLIYTHYTYAYISLHVQFITYSNVCAYIYTYIRYTYICIYTHIKFIYVLHIYIFMGIRHVLSEMASLSTVAARPFLILSKDQPGERCGFSLRRGSSFSSLRYSCDGAPHVISKRLKWTNGRYTVM